LVRDCTEGFRLGMSDLTAPNQCSQAVSNNIVADLNVTSADHSGTHIYLLPMSIWPYTAITNNLHYQATGRERFCVSFNLGIEQNYYSVAELRAATPFGGGSVEGNPKFVNVGALDFHLGSGSPAIGAGTRDWAYDYFRQLYNTSIDYYQDGAPRSSRTFDIGPLPGPS
ncbi:MAG TPA: hypothetical protein VMV81_02620, partial [Phycisphaerae bacterium]|nr:hypothetical protein [Phycisphaerae bacterium]